MKTIEYFKSLGLNAVIGDKYKSSNRLTEKTIGTYVHLFACNKEQLNDWARVYTEFAWRKNTGERPSFTGDIEWGYSNFAESHKVNMKDLIWGSNIIKWRPLLSPLSEDKPQPKESNMKPVFTQEMSDNGVLPPIGSECLVIGEKEIDDEYHKCEIIAHKNVSGDVFVAVFMIKNYNGKPYYYTHCSHQYFKPLDHRTDKEKAIDDIKLIFTSTAIGVDEVIALAFNSGVEWVGK